MTEENKRRVVLESPLHGPAALARIQRLDRAARTCRIPVGTAKSRLHRGMALLRQHVQQAYAGPR